ncbi:MAG: sel1 repeat family protein, partial [Planctomycetes bacterium]|nr:sel1 repeat family protein [Planctomycetota bacterium]
MRTIRYSITMMVVLLCVLFAGIWYIYSTDIPYAYYYPYIIFTLLFIAVMVITGELVVDDPSTRTQRWTNHFIMGLSFLLAAIWVGWTASKAIRYVFFSPPGYKVLPTSPFLPYTGTMPTYLLSPELRAQTEMRNDLLSANRGISASQARMGDRYALGNGVKKDDTYAFRWYRLAAQNGDIRSQLVTGDLYRRGIGVGMNKREAVRWFKEAARNNSPEAYYQLATMMYFGEYKSPSMERVVEYVERAENGGSVAARSFLSSFYYNGIVVEKDYGKAMRLAEASLSDATITSHMVLGMGQLFGFGVPRDASKAVENLTKAATKGNTTAKVLLSY